MRKLDALMKSIDQRVDQFIGPGYRYFGKYFTIFSGTLLSLIFLLVFFKMYYTKPYFVASLIKADLAQVESILHDIDKRCEILGVQSAVEPINFLTIKDFSGSMVGGINLAHPKNWKGPYLDQNPSIQKKFYELVTAQDGIFIVPGRGVQLPNGTVIGRDIMITKNTKVLPLTEPGGYLYYKGVPLAKKISFKVGDWSYTAPKEETLETINKTLREFNAAMPFSENEQTKTVST